MILAGLDTKYRTLSTRWVHVVKVGANVYCIPFSYSINYCITTSNFFLDYGVVIDKIIMVILCIK